MTETAQQYWEGFYQEKDRVWSGNPNPLLVREATSLTPGTALDLGCGEGADAIWLAERGWQVTAVDVSETVLRRAAARAPAGITWERHDLSQSFPSGQFDLVSAQFLHSPVAAPGEREDILRNASRAVVPGGVLLIMSHSGWPSWVETPPFEYHFPGTREMVESLALDPEAWEVQVEEVVERPLTGPDGEPGSRQDSVLRLRRKG
ncbi:class I SAM-dependent methyltransferase [Allokutzneria albata]|uniref:Ubiquinone/menaquinone biosynthesis C-methylase UbiE n=1 Tax=Allokutzneria albata TaxID=211114 RepID=A0A1G9U0J2_ALLAB|nr:class I SAM-dependent methyltransferase [Allokutzneria albata]SDM53527.1 Ubiquinone/menaquinone biosynthesis C-methylase UbiE [Allokutzneria albata]